MRDWDPRSIIGVASFILVLVVFSAILFDRTLLNSDAFLVLATAIVITGWVGGPVAWAYSATKGGGELADRNAKLVEDTVAAAPKGDAPQAVRIEQPKDEPIPTTETASAPKGERYSWER